MESNVGSCHNALSSSSTSVVLAQFTTRMCLLNIVQQSCTNFCLPKRVVHYVVKEVTCTHSVRSHRQTFILVKKLCNHFHEHVDIDKLLMANDYSTQSQSISLLHHWRFKKQLRHSEPLGIIMAVSYNMQLKHCIIIGMYQ